MSTALDPDFGHWLAGFADGEGSFGIIRPRPNRRAVVCRFRITLRRDDLAILEEIERRLGFGRVRMVNRTGATTSLPAAAWHTENKRDALLVTKVFDEFPLRAKKARDFATWRQAVFAWHAGDTATVLECDDVLRAGRQYDLDVRGPTCPIVGRTAQLELDAEA